MSKELYPEWICGDCGQKYGTVIPGHCCTMHNDICGWCGEWKAVTQPRDYRYPKAPDDLFVCSWCGCAIVSSASISGECPACSQSSMTDRLKGKFR